MSQLYSYIEYYGGSGIPLLNSVLTTLSGLEPYFNIHAQDIPIFHGIKLKNLFNYSKWNFNISGIGSDDTDFYFTVKNNQSDSDTLSILQVNKSQVTYVSGQLLNQSSGNLTFSSGNNGVLNVSVEPQITQSIPKGTYFWDIKNTGTNRQIRSFGYIEIDTPVTKSF